MAKSQLKLDATQMQAISRALSDPNRFAILQQIASEPGMGCSCLHAQQKLAPATISHHMKELQEAGLVEIERVGRSANLELRRDVWDAYLKQLATL